MHRSGTSALTRGLMALGVELGENLAGPAEDNPKGFWENLDIQALNRKIFREIGHRWDSVRPVPAVVLQDEALASLRTEAKNIVEEHFIGTPLWGVKDPRISRLLPFWVPVLRELDIEPHLVFALRNPISIARSLAARNSFMEEKSVLLCLGHWFDILQFRDTNSLMIVDYDRLLDSPQQCLAGIADHLGIRISSGLRQELDRFSEEFLSRSLRHSQASEKDNQLWRDRGGCFGLAMDLYSRLLEFSTERTKENRLDWIPFFRQFQNYYSLLSYMDVLDRTIHEQETKLAELSQVHHKQREDLCQELEVVRGQLAEREEQATSLALEKEDLCQELEAVRGQLAQKEAQAASLALEKDDLRQELEVVRGQLAEREEQAASLALEKEDLCQELEAVRGQLAQKEAQAASLALEKDDLRQDLETARQQLTQKKQQVESLSREVQSLSREVEELQHHYNSLLSYQSGLKEMLDRERYTVLKPMARRLYRSGAGVLQRMPPGLQTNIRRIKQSILPGTFALQVPPWPGPGTTAVAAESHDSSLQVVCDGDGRDVVVFPVIDYHFRVQRPQHLARGLADRGHRVFYLSTTFGDGEPGATLLEQVDERIYLCQLTIPGPHPVIYQQVPDEVQERWLLDAMDCLMWSVDLGQVVALVDHPFWRPVAMALPDAVVVYDCMDDHGGFSNNSEEILQAEKQLLQGADLVVTTSAPLSEKISRIRENILIRNAADSLWFSEPPPALLYSSDRPVVGYFGAISEWFDLELVIRAARACPEFDFVLVGSTFMCDTREAEEIENIHFIGEVPYASLKGYLYAFDVCMIPFRLIELIQCTNPVKLYEYLAAGRPVVATDMPELRLVREHVYLSKDSDDFIANIKKAMDSRDDLDAIEARRKFALENQWTNRVEALEEAIANQYPRVSVVVLTYNNLDYTRACLLSLEKQTRYPDWELIIVDNASSDGTPEFLADYAEKNLHVHLILNKENLGFAAGNNVGMRQATGEYIIVLNNDTYVTKGWMRDLVRHFQQDLSLGLVGPVTNNIGNEARIDIQYADMEEMARAAREYTRSHARRRLYVDTVAFFCAAIRRDVIDTIGYLDEDFGRGFFEDDDYCIRARKAGFKVAIADDVFVHHHLSASFNKLKEQERKQLFEKNRAVFEKKWGKWKPHIYRQ
ncbi:glycosyltransferase [Desulfolithobacter sp.]